MLSLPTRYPMSASPEYLDDGRPAKRPRQDSLLDTHRPPYNVPGPSVVPEAESAADTATKRNRKRPLSCGECRRLKLKCDRVFPCQSCCKRGCAEICPDGALTGGKGSRFILANTEQLHEKIKAMAERIRQLEDALQRLQSQHSADPHPLLQQDLLSIKRSPELFGMERSGLPPPSGSSGSRREEDDHPSIGSASSPVDAGDDQSFPVPIIASHKYLGLPEDIARLSRACPMPHRLDADLDPNLRQRIRDMLPPRSEALRICEQAQRNAFWHYSPDCSESFIPNLIHSVYTASIPALLPHRLSLFLIILAIGTAVDLRSQDQHAAERYHHLARAALCETGIIDDPSFDTIQTLFYMVWYLLMLSTHKRACEHAWGIMGLLAKLVQSLGLHRDGVGKMIPEELDKRKALLWNMTNVDIRLALMLRRPPSICLHHVDMKRPTYNFFDGSLAARVCASYHKWRDAFLQECQYPVLESVISPTSPSYSAILELDSKLRDFDIPNVLHMVDNDGIAPSHPVGLQQALTLGTREIAILHLHRRYLTDALSVTEGFTLNHKYAPSVLASFSSACNMIWAVHTCYKWEPDLTVRLSPIWANCLSAALVLCLVLGRAPSSPLSPHALDKLEEVRRLFLEVRDQCPAVTKALPVLEQCVEKTRSIYANWRNGCPEVSEHDEVCEFVYRTGMISREQSAVPSHETNPFERAHPALRRVFEQLTEAAAEAHKGQIAPCSPLPGGALTQSYTTSAERTPSAPAPGPGPAQAAVDALNGSECHLSQNTYTAGCTGSEFLDSSWMTWF